MLCPMKLTQNPPIEQDQTAMTTFTIEPGDRFEIGGVSGHPGDELYGEHPHNVLITFYDVHKRATVELAMPQTMWAGFIATLTLGPGNELTF